jgi:hypothetical protein
MTYTVNKEFMEKVQDELSNYLDDLFDFRTDYSGRYMYEQKCVAWVHDETDLRFGMSLLMAIRQIAEDDKKLDNALLTMARQEDWWQLINLIGGGKSDNLGRNTITYFPDIQFEEES